MPKSVPSIWGPLTLAKFFPSSRERSPWVCPTQTCDHHAFLQHQQLHLHQLLLRWRGLKTARSSHPPSLPSSFPTLPPSHLSFNKDSWARLSLFTILFYNCAISLLHTRKLRPREGKQASRSPSPREAGWKESARSQSRGSCHTALLPELDNQKWHVSSLLLLTARPTGAWSHVIRGAWSRGLRGKRGERPMHRT